MGLRIYNTLTRQKELFEPLIPGQVRMYVCGITAYDLSHIGHHGPPSESHGGQLGPDLG